MEITFLGAAGTVTGSKFVVRHGATRLLVDCGLFQGVKKLRQRNWEPLPQELAELDAVVLTHAHIDHTGYLPVLVRAGYGGPIYCTPATSDLASILLPDSGHIQEEDAKFANREGFSRHSPALPLYTESDARRALELLHPVAIGESIEVGGLRFELQLAGHILGATGATIRADGASLHFSGDLGRYEDPVVYPPEPPPAVDRVVMESTYGDRRHPHRDPLAALEAPVLRALERRGVVVIPSFAVGRAQAMLLCLWRLLRQGRVPEVPVHLDSPMATSVTRLYRRYHRLHRLTAKEAEAALGLATFVSTAGESKKLSASKGPRIIISASGMATAGRVLHHLKAFAPDPANAVILPSYQAPGTRGASLAAGAETVKIHGRYVPVRAEVTQLDLFSAHADRDDLLRWIGGAPEPPREVILVHGEPESADSLRRGLEEAGYSAHVAEHRETR